METLLQNIDWTVVIVSTILAFGLGWLWYSPLMFVKGWMEGIGEPVWRAPMWMPMMAQLGSTFLFAIIVNVAAADGHIGHAVLVGLTIAGFTKASGFYSGKSMYAVSVEVGYIVVMTILLMLTNMWL